MKKIIYLVIGIVLYQIGIEMDIQNLLQTAKNGLIRM